MKFAAVFIAGCLAAAVAAGCSATGSGVTGAGTTTPPANYRALVAAKFRALNDGGPVQSALITEPYAKFMGVFGGTRPVVCVDAVIPNLFGTMQQRYHLFYFDDGKVDGYRLGTAPTEVAMHNCARVPKTAFVEVEVQS